MKLIFLIYKSTKPNVEVSGWMYPEDVSDQNT